MAVQPRDVPPKSSPRWYVHICKAVRVLLDVSVGGRQRRNDRARESQPKSNFWFPSMGEKSVMPGILLAVGFAAGKLLR